MYTLLSWMVLPHILMAGPSYVYLHLPQERPFTAMPLVFQFLLWISYKIVFLLTELFLRDQGVGESWRSWLNPSHYKLMPCYMCEVGPCWFWQELSANPKKLMNTKPVSFTFVFFYVVIFIEWTTGFLLNLDSLKIAPWHHQCLYATTQHLWSQSKVRIQWSLAIPYVSTQLQRNNRKARFTDDCTTAISAMLDLQPTGNSRNFLISEV